MKLVRIHILNFMGIGEADLHFDRRGLVLVNGINHDSTTGSSNGAGKSTIYEAIYYALYGKTKRGVLGDDVINEKAGSDCRVELELNGYLVIRTRKDSRYGTALRLFQADESGWKDITRGTLKDTQELLEKIIGLSDLTFNKICYFGQGDLKPFASLSDRELKEVFEQALDLRFISETHSAVKSEISSKKLEFERIRADQKNLEIERGRELEKSTLLQAIISDLQGQSERERLRLKSGIKMEEVDLALTRATLRQTQDLFSTHSGLAEEIRARMARLKTLKSESDSRAQTLRAEKTRLSTQKAVAQEQLDTIMGHILEATRDGVCGECRRPFTVEDLAARRDALSVRADGIREEIAAIASRESALDQSLSEVAERARAIEKQLDEENAALAQMATLAFYKVKIDSLQEQMKSGINRLSNLRQALIDLNNRDNTAMHQADLLACKTRLRNLDKQLNSLSGAHDELAEELESLQLLEEIFSNTGMKSYIFDAVTPELNRLINSYLNLLNPDVTVEVSTVTRLRGKKDQFRERFAIKVSNANGAKSYEGNSDGEKQMVNLAVALAFNTLCRAMARGSVNFLWMDEPFESLDESNAERAIELCEAFSGQVDNLFITTHNWAIKDLVPSGIVVEKRNGMAILRQNV